MHTKYRLKGYTVLFNVTLLLLMFGCKGEEGAEGPLGPTGPNLKGDIIGYCRLIDVNGIRALDISGITVSIEGTSISTTTASDGRWVLSDISTGTYTIVFSQTGYGIRKEIGFQFVGGGQIFFGLALLHQVPEFVITNLTADTSNGTININGSLSGVFPNDVAYVRFFIGTSANISSDPANYMNNVSRFVIPDTNLTVMISGSFLNNLGMSSGQTVYLIGYADGFTGGTSYIDLATGRFIYTSLNPTPSNVVSVVVP